MLLAMELADHHLLWWMNPSNILRGVLLDIQIFMEALLSGWRAHYGVSVVLGKWSISGSKLHINVLDMKAMRHIIISFLDISGNHHVLINQSISPIFQLRRYLPVDLFASKYDDNNMCFALEDQ